MILPLFPPPSGASERASGRPNGAMSEEGFHQRPDVDETRSVASAPSASISPPPQKWLHYHIHAVDNKSPIYLLKLQT